MIRFATINDCEQLAKVHVDTWLTTYRAIVPDSYLNRLTYETSKKRFEDLIAHQINHHLVYEINSHIVGFVSFGKERSHQNPYIGEIHAIYVLKEVQGKGIGRQLFQQACSELFSTGIHSLLVWVLEKNPSNAFYQRLGGEVVDQKEVLFDQHVLIEIAYGFSKRPK